MNQMEVNLNIIFDISEEDEEANEINPQPAKKKRSFTRCTKLEVIKAARLSSISEVPRSYGIARQVCK